MKKLDFSNTKIDPFSIRSIKVIRSCFGRVYVQILTDHGEHREGWESEESAAARKNDLHRYLFERISG